MTQSPDDYARAVTVIDVLDGDTFRCDVDLGFYVRVRMSCRLNGLNAPEHNQPGGPEARAALAAMLERGAVSIRSVSVDKFSGRFDAEVYVTVAPANGTTITTMLHINARLIEQGFAAPWDGKGPRPLVFWPPKS